MPTPDEQMQTYISQATSLTLSKQTATAETLAHTLTNYFLANYSSLSSANITNSIDALQSLITTFTNENNDLTKVKNQIDKTKEAIDKYKAVADEHDNRNPSA